MKVYQIPVAGADREDDEKDDEGEGKTLPRVTEGQVLKLDTIRPDQHFTEPPPRYTEATLVKELKKTASEGRRRTRRLFPPSWNANM